VPVAVLFVAYVLWTLLSRDYATRKVVSDLAQAAASILGLVWSLWSRRRATSNHARWSAGFITLAVAAWGAGQAYWCYTELLLHRRSFPSWADAGYITASLSMVAGILLLPGHRASTSLRIRALLDSLLVMSGVIAFGWFFVLGPTILSAKGTPLAKGLGAAYPLLDLMVVFCAMVVASRSSGPGAARIRNLLYAAALAYVASDGAFAVGNLQATYQSGGPLDVGWMVATLLMGRAAAALRSLKPSEDSAPVVPVRVPGPERILLPYALVPAVGALVAYAWRAQVASGLANGVYVSAGLLVVLLLARQLLSLADTSRLYRELRKAYEDLEALATYDGMTGLANHRTFQERLREEIVRSRAENTPLALLLVDVDHFKAYNDRFGHPAGDQALKIVARLLGDSLRASDLAARYGGEEFAAILPATGATGAGTVAERVRAACEAMVFPNRAVTLSIGVALLEGSDAGEVIEAADQALYAAKRGGRNRVVVTGVTPVLFVVGGEDETTDQDQNRAA